MTRSLHHLPVVIIIGLILASTLLLGGVTTPTATADRPNVSSEFFAEAYSYTDTSAQWTPPDPPQGANISVVEYATMWTETTDAEIPDQELSDALNNSDDSLHPYLYGVAFDFSTPEPSPLENRWNSRIVNRVNGGGDDDSIAPENADLNDDEDIHDAYLSLIDITPHAIVHADEGDTEYRVPRTDAEIISMFDYRTTTVSTDVRGDRDSVGAIYRNYIYSRETEVSNIVVKADGVEVVNSGISTGASQISYDELPAGETELTATVTIKYSYDVKEKANPCEDVESYTSDATDETYEWCGYRGSWYSDDVYIVDEYTKSSQVTVTDTMTVTVQNQSQPTGRSHKFKTNGGFYKLQLETPHQYGSIRTGNRNWANGPYDFYLAHNQETETIIQHNSTGGGQIDAGFVTVENHAYPPKSVGVRPDNQYDRDKIGQGISTMQSLDSTLSARSHNTPSIPSTVKLDTADEGMYLTRGKENFFARYWETSPADDEKLRLQTVIPGETRQYQLTEVPTTELSLETETAYLTGEQQVEKQAASGVRITFTLTDEESNRVNLDKTTRGTLKIVSPLDSMTVKTNRDLLVFTPGRRAVPVNDGEGDIHSAGNGEITIDYDYPAAAGRFSVEFEPSVYWPQSGPYYLSDDFDFQVANAEPNGLQKALWGWVDEIIAPIVVGAGPALLMYGTIHYAITGRVPNPF